MTVTSLPQALTDSLEGVPGFDRERFLAIRRAAGIEIGAEGIKVVDTWIVQRREAIRRTFPGSIGRLDQDAAGSQEQHRGYPANRHDADVDSTGANLLRQNNLHRLQ